MAQTLLRTTLRLLWPNLNSLTARVILPAEPSYQDLVEFLEPHLGTRDIERLRVFWTVRDEPEYLDMFVDENGLRKGLPRNEAATRIYRNNVLVHEPQRYRHAEQLSEVVGPAALFYDRVWF